MSREPSPLLHSIQTAPSVHYILLFTLFVLNICLSSHHPQCSCVSRPYLFVCTHSCTVGINEGNLANLTAFLEAVSEYELCRLIRSQYLYSTLSCFIIKKDIETVPENNFWMRFWLKKVILFTFRWIFYCRYLCWTVYIKLYYNSSFVYIIQKM